ncbi:SDR family oxidoreductase [Cellvibrio fibrivorans]|uniref:NAD(P)H dehydrogenase (Quinone) n=1 Tax=Cellvibrio fibrivorans TaxID=126350 RepID=A0ABU1UT61_9GAMM|nr:SDR family oxidoreductase [Cellvibrio fibrivorans]MDR7088369.1 NAD(P)H dehydrogenase (quinone) [Cellvibrio fibrivorans]
MIAITGATGQLGRLVIEQLLQNIPANQLIALVRNPAKASDLQARGLQVRAADYTQPAALEAALQGVEKLLLISSSEVGQRLEQHRNVVAAAKRSGVTLLAYTSILNAQDSQMDLAHEHRETEQLIKASGIPFVLLRNGWYTENYTAGIPTALQFNVLLGSAGDGKISLAARADYAAAAAEVLVRDDQAGKIYELAGDAAYTLADFAAELSRQTGKQIPYNNLPEAEYRGILQNAGLPDWLASLLASSDASAAQGALFDESHQLSRLIGRATTPLADTIRTALAEGATAAAH